MNTLWFIILLLLKCFLKKKNCSYNLFANINSFYIQRPTHRLQVTWNLYKYLFVYLHGYQLLRISFYSVKRKRLYYRWKHSCKASCIVRCEKYRLRNRSNEVGRIKRVMAVPIWNKLTVPLVTKQFFYFLMEYIIYCLEIELSFFL